MNEFQTSMNFHRRTKQTLKGFCENCSSYFLFIFFIFHIGLSQIFPGIQKSHLENTQTILKAVWRAKREIRFVLTLFWVALHIERLRLVWCYFTVPWFWNTSRHNIFTSDLVIKYTSCLITFKEGAFSELNSGWGIVEVKKWRCGRHRKSDSYCKTKT